ncbi:MAG: VWA domain-containing protein [Acidobacteriota bacterium]|nr:MAG: VWA domain-containing protein [Acidobacteriota bacterium]
MIKNKLSNPLRTMVWLLLASILPAIPARGQDQERETATIRLATDLVSIDISVADRTGNKNIAGLEASDFAVYEDGVRQKISIFSASDVPFNVVLLIDTSGSTREEINLIRQAASSFLGELRPDDKVAIIQFNKQIELIRDLTSDRGRLSEGLETLRGGSGTSFYDALQLTIDEILKPVSGRKAIVALTDGVDSYGFSTYQQILPLAERSGASLYFLELDTEAFTQAGMMRSCADENHFEFSEKQLKKYFEEHVRGGSEKQYEKHCLLTPLERMQINRRLYQSARRELAELAEKTGARVFRIKQLSEAVRAYSEIAAELRTLYSVAYYPTNERHNGKWRTLRVTVRRQGLSAHTRPGYRAPLD